MIAAARVVDPPRSARLTVYWGHVQGRRAEILVDSGASTIFLSEAFIRKHHIKTCKRPIPITIEFAGVTEEVSTRMVPGVQLALGDYEEALTFEITTASYDVILGKSWLDEHNAEIITCSHDLFFQHKGKKHVVGKESLVGHAKEAHSSLQTVQHTPTDTTQNTSDLPTDIQIISGKGLSKVLRHHAGHLFAVRVMERKDETETDKLQVEPEFRPMVEALMEEFKETFQEAIPITPEEQIHGVKHDIIIEPGAAPTVAPMYRLSSTELKELKKKVDDLLERGHIRASSSPYAAGVLFVPKKGGALRMCIDYRQLNKTTTKNRYPLPLIDELLEKLQAAKVFTKMDLTDGYHHIPIAENDRQKTAFRTPMGLYEYTVMPFGLANAPATFQRFMNDIFRDMTDSCLVVYMDDLLVHSRTPQLHQEHLRKVLERLQEKKMCVKLSKSHFFQKKVEFLGYIVGQGTVSPDPEKVRAIVEWPSPLPSVTAVRSFLGLAQFYKRFIPNFSEKAAALTNLTKTDRQFTWGDTEEKAFTMIKQCLVNLPAIHLPQVDEPFKLRVQTDASGFAVGAVLHQVDAEGHEVPVAYASRKLEQRELGRPVHEKEFIAIHFALTKWRHLLLGREFSVYTDHHSLQFFMTQKKLDARFARMAGYLSQFDLKINYKPGKENQVPDALSRRHDYEAKPEVNTIKFVAQQTVIQEWIAKIQGQPLNPKEQAFLQKCGTQPYVVTNTRRYRKQAGILWTEDEDGWKMVVPPGLVTELIERAHKGAIGACQGFTKTLEYLRRAFYWGGMFVDVQKYIRKCSSCAQNKDSTQALKAPLHPIPPAEERWQSISMDFITDLPITQEGKDAILTVVDSLTKQAHFVPCLKTDSASDVAVLFRREIWRHHGLPKIMISDRDSRFVSDFWTALNRLLNITGRTSTAFHPQTDGQTERANRTIEQILRFYCSQQQDKWGEFLDLAEFAYNNAQHSTTGVSPFVAAYGYSPAMDLPDQVHARNRMVQDHVKYMSETKEQLKKAIEKVQEYQKKQADQHGRKERSFEVGDWVWLNTTNLNFRTLQKKLAPRFVGPFKIRHKVSEVAYALTLPHRWRVHHVFYIGLLKAYEGNDPERDANIPVLTAGYTRDS